VNRNRALPEWSVQEKLLVAGLLAASVAVCLPGLEQLAIIWDSTDYYGHGYLVPAAAGWVLWTRRADVATALREPPPALGFVPMLLAASFELLMVAGDLGFLAGIAVPVVLLAGAYAIAGMTLVRVVWLPALLLALMVPPPRFLTYQLLAHLKLFVTSTATEILQLAGYTVTAQGNRLLLPDHELFVADACSGLTSIVTLLPLACIIAYFLSRGVWRRAVIVASLVPLAIGGNLFRVVVTTMLVESRGIEFTQGLLHESFGVATYAIGTVALVGIARVLR
jgi:exosortase